MSLDATARAATGAADDAHPPNEARCLGCDYRLRGLTSNRCPECARPFDPDDPWTMSVGRPHGRIVAALLSPIGWPTYTLAAIATVAVFWWIAALPAAPTAMRIGLSGWVAVYAYRLARYIGRVVCGAIYLQPRRRERKILFFALILLTGLMMWTRFPFYLAFALHKPALDRVALRYYEEVPMLAPPSPPERIGFYRVSAIHLDVNGVTIDTGNGTTFRYAAEERWTDRYYYRPVMGKWHVSRGFESQFLVRPVDFIIDRVSRWMR